MSRDAGATNLFQNLSWSSINPEWLLVITTAAVGIITIIAIIRAPIIALRVQKVLDALKEKNQQKLAIFKTLMATCATPISPEHVNALNMINIEFYGNEPVITKWKTYLNHLISRPPVTLDPARPLEVKEKAAQEWFETRSSLFIDLLVSISQQVNLPFDKATLSSCVYFPGAFQEKLNDETIMRKQFIKLLAGDTTLAVKFPVDLEAQKKQNILQDSLSIITMEKNQ